MPSVGFIASHIAVIKHSYQSNLEGEGLILAHNLRWDILHYSWINMMGSCLHREETEKRGDKNRENVPGPCIN